MPHIKSDAGPAYIAIADALEADLRAGRVKSGELLPTQRELARRLGVNFTTITRAYAEAQRRGLLTATVGRGTFATDPMVRAPLEPTRAFREYDLSVNAPPVLDWMPDAVGATLVRLGNDPAVAQHILTYDSRLGDERARESGVAWLRWRGLEAEAGRVVVTAGAQHALALILSTFVKPGETVLTEALAYPGLHAAAALAHVKLAPVAIDDEGIEVESFAQLCASEKPTALFCVPTLQNPTAAVMSLQRRHDLLAVARKYRVRVVEDDICGALVSDAVPLARIAPDQVIHIASLSKCVAPGFRTAFVHLPSAADADRLATTVRTSLLMLSPASLALAIAWIGDGIAEKAVNDIRAEMIERTALAREILGKGLVAPASSLHGWLRLPASITPASFVAQAQQRGVRVAPSDWYVTRRSTPESAPAPNAVRVTLGAESERLRLEHALRALAEILDQPEALRASSL